MQLVDQIFNNYYTCLLSVKERSIIEPKIELPKFELNRARDPHHGGGWMVQEDPEHDAMLERFFQGRPRETGCAESDKFTLEVQHPQPITINQMVEIFAIAEVIRFAKIDDLVTCYNTLEQYLAEVSEMNNGGGHRRIPQSDIDKMSLLLSSWEPAFACLTESGHKDDFFSTLFNSLTDIPAVIVEGNGIEIRGPSHCNFNSNDLPFQF